ncbi:hypothetical protein B0T21DRAFT_375044 [Apiosordaria backusii]|uniref:F-box domain-containing protein n=1 Tax=Apiosordaria backusii TaxID=314023 RepID=A0AA40AIK9_9PEZI|nr:hypothetical protein B0T21DRAFT_375044 [Apiosordaria backusii]
MSPTGYTCPICEWDIYDNPSRPTWRNEFRGLYRCSIDSKITITGVGVYHDPHSGILIAPPNFDMRYDDHDYTVTPEHQFGRLRYEVNHRHGYPIHNVCWKLLEQAMYPDPVPVDKLFWIFDSLTDLGSKKLDWGYKENPLFPWERGINSGERCATPPCPWDPFSVNVEQIIRDRFGTYDIPVPPASMTSGTPLGNDPFLSLPEELCTIIATYLPTHDALSARLASRSFWHLFDRQQFWASRFMGRNSELSWLFEVRRGSNKAARDWRWLYHRISVKIHDLNNPVWGGLYNRQQIWAHILPIVDILELRPSPLVPPPGDSKQPELTWRVGGSAEQDDDTVSPLAHGCRPVYNQYLPISRNKARVSVSTVLVGSFIYIAGLSVEDDSQTVKVGYTGPKENEQSVEVDMAGLRGINIAVGLGGIHALQFVDSSGPARWLGSPDDAAKTTRLSGISGATGLEVSFDAFRLLEISAIEEKGLGNDNVNSNVTLRNSAIWYPDIPPAHLDLNDDFFLPAHSYKWGFRPLFWTHFGGPGGIYLKHLHGLTWETYDVLTFETNEERVPSECRTFGRAPLLRDDDSCSDLGGDFFAIDGPGGERINAIEIWQKYYTESSSGWLHSDGALASFTIFTNRGRSHQFGEGRTRWNVKKRRFKAPPGHIITGFYGAQNRSVGYGIVALGVITELEP